MGIVCYEINRKEKKKNKSDNNVILNKHNSKYNYSSENKPNPKPSLIYGLENNKRIENKSTGNNNGKIKTENKKDKISIKQKDVINLPTKNIINIYQEVLNLHNKERKNRGFKELILDKHLNGLAQKYAALGEMGGNETEQDRLNELCRGRILFLDPNWNAEAGEKMEFPDDDPRIIHFRPGLQPWQYEALLAAAWR